MSAWVVSSQGIVGSVVLTGGRWRRRTLRLTPVLDVHAPLGYHGNKGVNMFCWLHAAEETETGNRFL